MRRVSSITLTDVLAEWARHECRGRLQRQFKVPPEFVEQLEGPNGDLFALEVILQARSPVLARVFHARPTECVRAELGRADLPLVRVMVPRESAWPLREYTEWLMTAEDDAGRWARHLAAGGRVEGFLAVARSADDGSVTLLDGLSRAAAWVTHGDAGRHYPLVGNLILTEHPTVYEAYDTKAA